MSRRLYSTVMFVCVSVLGGVLVAGLAVPSVGVAAELAKAGALTVRALPREVETPPPAEGSTVYMADGTVLTTFFNENRVYVPLSEISAMMQQAQISVEDQRFYHHGALDLKGTLRALVRTSSGNTQGGSTLTQQYVKLALIDKAVADNDKEALAAARERTFGRKLLELRYAIALEDKLSKDEILERYLNLAYYGAGAYGVEAAAQRYFGIPASELNLAQAALLAGLVRNPVTTDPIRYEKLALERRNNVLDVMLRQGAITAEQAEQAKVEGFDRSRITEVANGCVSSEFPHLCSVVEKTLLQMPSLGGGTTAAEKEAAGRLLKRGGLTIETAIDPRTQRAAQEAVSRYVYPTDPVIGLMTMIEPGTGLIKAVAQSRYEIGAGPGQSYWNYAMESNLGGAEGFKGGSTYKMFVLAAAVAKGFPTSRSYESPASKDWSGERFRTCDGVYVGSRGWTVRGVSGHFDMYSGAANSVNNYFVALQQDVGLCEVTQMARTLGLNILPGRNADGTKETIDQAWSHAQLGSFTLGAREASPISLANAYATIAARGVRCDPIILSSVSSKAGRDYEVPDANCQQVIPAAVADRVTDILRGPFQSGTARAANIPGYDIAGKTGTDTGTPTIWTVGFTPQLVGAATLTVDPKADRYKYLDPNNRSLTGAPVRNGSARLSGSSGGEAGAGIWKPAMTAALEGLPRGRFVKPTAIEVETVDLPSCSGLNDCRQQLRDAGFGTSISRITHSSPEGTFLGMDPKRRAPRYSTVRLLVSSGPAYTPAPASTPAQAEAQPPEGNR